MYLFRDVLMFVYLVTAHSNVNNYLFVKGLTICLFICRNFIVVIRLCIVGALPIPFIYLFIQAVQMFCDLFV